MEAATKGRGEVSEQELRRAEAGLVRLLHAKRFPREWIERHVPDVMGQARADFAARLAAGREDDTVNLLVVIGYRRAIKVLDAELLRPRTTSVETIFHLADESTPTPEQEAMDNDRQERVVAAIGHLPERERKLLALVYFEGMSIRAAGRRLGWGKSAADRHHKAALERLEAMLDRSLLAPELALPAFVAARQRSLPQTALAWLEAAAQNIRESLAHGGSRLGPFAEAGNAAALSGAGRTAAGVCGAAVLACLVGVAGGVVGPARGQAHVEPGGAAGLPRVAQAGRAPAQAEVPPPPSGPAAAPREPSSLATSTRQSAAAAPDPTTPDARREMASNASSATATPRETVEEFGIESGEVDEATTTSAVPSPSGPTSPEPTRLAGPTAGTNTGAASNSSGAAASGPEAASEFGL